MRPDADLPPVAGILEDYPPDVSRLKCLQRLTGQRALCEDEDIVSHVDDRFAGAGQVPVRPRVGERTDGDGLLAPHHSHGREVWLPGLVQCRDDSLDDHSDLLPGIPLPGAKQVRRVRQR